MVKKTSGHIRPCNVGVVEAHNERTEKYLEGIKKAGLKIYFFPELSHRNSSWVNDRYEGKTCAQIFEDMKEHYTQKHGQAPQLKEKQRVNKKTGRVKVIAGWSPLREMVAVIKEDTKIEDFDFFKKWAKDQGLDIVRIDLHKDEGHRDDKGKIIENFHAHVVLDFYDRETGKTVNLGKDKLSELQSILAISLDMERGEKKEDTGHEHLDHVEYKKMIRDVNEANKRLEAMKAEEKKAETRVKGLTTMLSNLQSQYDVLKKDYENKMQEYDDLYMYIEMGAAAQDEIDEDLNEKKQQKAKLNGELEQARRQLSELESKMNERRVQLDTAQQQLQKVVDEKTDLEKRYNELHPEFLQMQENFKKKVKEQEQILKEKQKAIDTMVNEQEMYLKERQKEIENLDREGLMDMYRLKMERFRDYIFKRSPGGREAVDAICQRTVSRTAHNFTERQALAIEKCLAPWENGREKVAENLMELAKIEMTKPFGRPENEKWIEQTAKELLQIAERTHPLSAVLAEYIAESAGGGPSHITDLTDWSGRKR